MNTLRAILGLESVGRSPDQVLQNYVNAHSHPHLAPKQETPSAIDGIKKTAVVVGTLYGAGETFSQAYESPLTTKIIEKVSYYTPDMIKDSAKSVKDTASSTFATAQWAYSWVNWLPESMQHMVKLSLFVGGAYVGWSLWSWYRGNNCCTTGSSHQQTNFNVHFNQLPASCTPVVKQSGNEMQVDMQCREPEEVVKTGKKRKPEVVKEDEEEEVVEPETLHSQLEALARKEGNDTLLQKKTYAKVIDLNNQFSNIAHEEYKDEHLPELIKMAQAVIKDANKQMQTHEKAKQFVETLRKKVRKESTE